MEALSSNAEDDESSSIEPGERVPSRFSSMRLSEEQRRKLVGVYTIIGKVLLSYFDVLTDIVLAVTLLSTDQAAYGVVSFGILGLSLIMQAFVMKSFGKAPWLSKDVFVTAILKRTAISMVSLRGQVLRPPSLFSEH